MDALPQFSLDNSASSAPTRDVANNIASVSPVSLADANSAGGGAAPPHLLWKTLESAYAAPSPPEIPLDPAEPRLAGYIALPIVLGLSLVLWVAVVELVLMR